VTRDRKVDMSRTAEWFEKPSIDSCPDDAVAVGKLSELAWEPLAPRALRRDFDVNAVCLFEA
jgi:hypothetical protein